MTMNNSSSNDYDRNSLSIINLFDVVRDIPYGNIGVRNLNILLEKKMASCSGKHFLLGKLYELSGLQVKYMIGKTNLRDFNRYLPARMHTSEGVFDFHNYLKVFYNHKWITVDATFDKPLVRAGVPVNLRWDGKKDCVLAFDTVDNKEVEDIIKSKEDAIRNLNPTEKKKRRVFYRNLVAWFDEIRTRHGICESEIIKE